jgi:hypothetical protein
MKVRSPSVEIEIANDVKKKCALEAVNGNSNFDGDRVLCFDVVSSNPTSIVHLY